MNTSTKTATVLLAVTAGLAALVVPNVLESLNFSKQKRTMAAMRQAAIGFEKGQPFPPIEDAWGHPMRIRVRGRHYSIRAAGRDGILERDEQLRRVRVTRSFDADIVFVDGNFVQMPEGI